MRRRVPGRARQRLRGLARVRQPLLAGRLHRRRGGADPRTTTSARAATTSRERVIQQLLREAGATTSTATSSRSPPRASRRRPTGRTCDSPETYLGYEQGQSFASPDVAAFDEPQDLDAPDAAAEPVGAGRRLDARRAGERARTRPAGGSPSASTPATSISSWARASAARPSRSACCVDGEPPGDAHGLDVDEDGDGTRRPSQRLYQLIRQPGRSTTARSRSSSSSPASRRTASRSASPDTRPSETCPAAPAPTPSVFARAGR